MDAIVLPDLKAKVAIMELCSTSPREQAALTLRQLKREARAEAERELQTVPETKNTNAFMSRHTKKHYERLLAQHVAAAEKEQARAQCLFKQYEKEVQALRNRATELTHILHATQSNTSSSYSEESTRFERNLPHKGSCSEFNRAPTASWSDFIDGLVERNK